jgi:hypothetical protein
MKTTRSLSFFVAVWMAAAIAASMAAYGVYEYAAMPGHTLRELAIEHLGHVLALGLLTYALCWAVFYFVLLRPLGRIYLHLYTVGAGRLKTLELHSNVREIRTIVDGVNLMLSRLKLGADSDALELAQQRIAEIRDVTRQLATADHEHFGILLDTVRDKLADLEKALPHILAAQGSLSGSSDAGAARGPMQDGPQPDAAASHREAPRTSSPPA